MREKVLGNRHTSLVNLALHMKPLSTLMVEILRMRHVAFRLVPRELEFGQKQHRKTAVEDTISEANNDQTCMKRLITGDET